MRPKLIVVLVLILVVISGFSALIGYRSAYRHAISLRVPAGAPPGCRDFHEAGSHIGETGCISGQVVRVFTSRAGNTFLDFCQDYRNCPFTSVIFSSDRSRFGNLSSLAGRQVEISGPITAYNGRAEIIIRKPEQIHEAAR